MFLFFKNITIFQIPNYIQQHNLLHKTALHKTQTPSLKHTTHALTHMHMHVCSAVAAAAGHFNNIFTIH